MKKRKWWVLILLAAVLLAGVCARPGYMLYKDLSFGWSDHTPAEYRVKAYAQERGISYGEYPRELLELLERNPEAEEFVLNYPFREPAASELPEMDRETVPLLLQWDPRWGYERYGDGCVGVTGCGPTCLAMVRYYLTGDRSMTPADVARFAKRNGYYAPGYGSSWKLISKGSADLGLEARELPLVKAKITAALESGEPVILALGRGDFTSGGHYIVLTAAGENGFRVNDPNSPARSEQWWTYEALEGQIRNIWAIRLGETD